MQRQTDSQSWITDRAKEQQYISSSSGICYGYSHMVVRAIMADDVDTLSDRITLIKRIDELYLLKKIINDRKGQQYPLRLIKSPVSDLLTITDGNNTTTIVIAPPLLTIHDEAELRELINSIPPFYEGIELLQQAYLDRYKGLFENSITPNFQSYQFAHSLTLPDKLKQNGDITEMSNFSGQYKNLSDLEDYVNSFKNIIQESGGTVPLAVVLESGDHAITMGFNPSKNELVLCDVNNPTIKRFNLNDQAGMAASIQKAFFKSRSSSHPVMFTSRIFLPGNKVDELHSVVDRWRIHSENANLNKIDSITAAARDPNGATWLHIAARDGQTTTVKRLLHHNANPNARFRGMGPLYIATERDQVEVVKDLLQTGATVDQKYSGATPLFLAADYGYHEIAETLLDHGADYNITFCEKTSLAIAKERGHAQIIKSIAETESKKFLGNLSIWKTREMDNKNIKHSCAPAVCEEITSNPDSFLRAKSFWRNRC